MRLNSMLAVLAHGADEGEIQAVAIDLLRAAGAAEMARWRPLATRLVGQAVAVLELRGRVREWNHEEGVRATRQPAFS